MAVNVLPEPVAIWTRARGRSALRDASIVVMASIWRSRSPVGSRGGRPCRAARSDGGAASQSRSDRGLWKLKTSLDARRGIAAVREAGDGPCGLVNEGQRVRVVDPLKRRGGVARGPILHHRDVLAPCVRLGRDHADGATIHDENAVGEANARGELPHGDPKRRGEVHRLVVLDRPTRRLQAGVDQVARRLLGVLVRGQAGLTRAGHAIRVARATLGTASPNLPRWLAPTHGSAVSSKRGQKGARRDPHLQKTVLHGKLEASTGIEPVYTDLQSAA